MKLNAKILKSTLCVMHSVMLATFVAGCDTDSQAPEAKAEQEAPVLDADARAQRLAGTCETSKSACSHAYKVCLDKGNSMASCGKAVDACHGGAASMCIDKLDDIAGIFKDVLGECPVAGKMHGCFAKFHGCMIGTLGLGKAHCLAELGKCLDIGLGKGSCDDDCKDGKCPNPDKGKKKKKNKKKGGCGDKGKDQDDAGAGEGGCEDGKCPLPDDKDGGCEPEPEPEDECPGDGGCPDGSCPDDGGCEDGVCPGEDDGCGDDKGNQDDKGECPKKKKKKKKKCPKGKKGKKDKKKKDKKKNNCPKGEKGGDCPWPWPWPGKDGDWFPGKDGAGCEDGKCPGAGEGGCEDGVCPMPDDKDCKDGKCPGAGSWWPKGGCKDGVCPGTGGWWPKVGDCGSIWDKLSKLGKGCKLFPGGGWVPGLGKCGDILDKLNDMGKGCPLPKDKN